MEHWLLILLGTVLVNNIVMTQMLGLCPFMGVSRKVGAAAGMGMATAFVLTLSAGASHLIEYRLLAPSGLEYLRTPAFIVVIAAVVQFTELFVRKSSPLLHQALGLYLPLITTNCAVLGIALLNVREQRSLPEALLTGFGGALGFALALVLFAAQRERLESADVPAPFRGASIAMITAGLFSLAFLGFSGLVR